jgi:hypothetical protein
VKRADEVVDIEAVRAICVLWSIVDELLPRCHLTVDRTDVTTPAW